MADQLMDVISGASHGSYSFIHDNYIYRINKFTHKRVYLSCRLSRCRGAGKGVKGSTRAEVYGFKLSKPHNHPPEESKIKHFEVKEFVREEARCTTDSSKNIYERAVKLFDCYELSRACVDGLVKRSRERTAAEVSERPETPIVSRGVELDTKSVPLSVEEEHDDNLTVTATYDEQYEDEELKVYEDEESAIEVVVREEEEEKPLEPHEVPVEYVEVDEGVDQDAFLLEDPEKPIIDEAESPYSNSNLDESCSPEESSYDSDSLSEPQSQTALPNKRFKESEGGSINVFKRLSDESWQGSRATNCPSYRRSLKRRLLCESDDGGRIKKHLGIEESLMKIFSSTYFSSKDNVFNLMSHPESIPDYDDEQNSLASANSLNIIKSASKLCTFTAVKASQMRSLLVGKTKELRALEGVLLEHFGNVMCFSGTEFFEKCFGRTLQEAIEQGRKGDWKCRAAWNEDEVYGNRDSKNDLVQLAIALLFYSGKAYLALSELIDLPGPHVARKWATNTEGNPGFSAQPFAAIQSEVLACRTKTIYVCLSMEDVELKRHVDVSNGQLFGYTDLGYGRVESDSIPQATRAVVFFTSALNSHWKVPLGYCLADDLSPQVRANLLCQFVSKLEFNGVKCVGIVLNNSTTSTRIYEEFGVISKRALPLGTLYTNADEKIRVSPFADILEVMESVRQLLREKQNVYSSTGGVISWLHLEFTQQFVNSENAEWALIPGTYTLDFMKRLKYLKIKIRKDPWPFGRYYPVLMKILKEFGANLPRDFDSTIKFVENMVEITDFFTSCNRFHDESSLTNNKRSLAAVNKLLHYLEGLRFPSGGFVKDEDRRMPIMNLCMNLSSLKVLLRRVSPHKIGVFHRLTLRNVRRFISGIRVEGVYLTPVQFRERYFERMQNLDISPSGGLNSRSNHDNANKKPPVESTFFSYNMYIYSPIRSMCDQVLQYFVEKVINVWLDSIDCPECFDVMLDSLQSEESDLHRDLVRMIRLVETELCVMNDIPIDLADGEFRILVNKVLNGLVSLDGFKLHAHLFVSAEFGGTCHFTYLVKDIVKIYLKLRMMYLSREVKIGINDFQESSMKFSRGNFWA